MAVHNFNFTASAFIPAASSFILSPVLTQEGRFWRAAPLIILAYALQTTGLLSVHWGAAQLDLPFLVALCVAIEGGAARGALAGAGAGYLAGLAAMLHPGSLLVSRLIPCAVAGWIAPLWGRNNPFIPPILAALGTLLADGIFLLFSPGEWNWAYWSAHAPASMLLHALAIWPMLWLVRRVVRPPKPLAFS